MLASGLVWPSKWVVQAVMTNRMHRQGLEGRSRKNFAFLMSESRSPKKWCAIAHENRRNEGYALFEARLTFQISRTSRDGQPYASTSYWRTSTKIFGIFDIGIRISQKMVCYSTRKLSKWGVCSLRGSFDLPNGSYKLWWQPLCIDKVLTDVLEKISHFRRRNSDHPKNGVL